MLRTEVVKIGERNVEVKELSFAAQLRLEKLDKITNEDIFKECLSQDDFNALETLGKRECKDLRLALWRVNGWDVISTADIKKN